VEGSKAMKDVDQLCDEGLAVLTPELAGMNSLFFALSIVAVILGGIIATSQ
jgi:hypothetical protein